MDTTDIQILAYRKGHDKATGKPYVYQKHFSHIQVSSINSLFRNLEAIVNLIPEGDRWDVHYTCANCYKPTEDKTVPLRLFHHQTMIPIDLDGIDLGKWRDYVTIVIDSLKLDINKTGIFNSGHGLHFVIELSQPIDTGEELHKLQAYYKELCNNLSIEFFNAGLSGNADPVRLAESATLRLPMTYNCKDTENKVLASVIQGNVEPQDFYLNRLVDIKETKEIALTLRAVDSKAVLNGCAFLSHCYQNPNSITEPQWYAMLGILSFIPDTGIDLCHTYSKEHKDYSFEDTQTKAEQAQGFGKPRTCQSVHQVFPSCVKCENFGKCNTPISIRSEEFIATEATGFHDVITAENGQQKFVPNYGDLVKHFSKKHSYVVNKETKRVSVYNGKFWETLTSTEIDAFATDNFLPLATINKRNEFRGLITSTNVVGLDFFTKDSSGFINFNNGVLNLFTRKLEEHSMSYGFTYVLPYDYNPSATCPEFDKMLDNVTIYDKEIQQLLLEYLGYAISGIKANFGAKALILTGTGANGKSTFLNVIKMLIGKDCYSAVSLIDMSNPNSRYSLVGKLFNICEEVEEDELRKGTAIFKSIVTGADLMVKKLYEDTSMMRIDAKLIVSCNELPSSKENTYAIYRRMLIVPFKASFKGNSADKGIEQRISKEMSGVYNRILTAYDTFVLNNYVFSESKQVTKALEDYRYNNSIFNQFKDACLDIGTKEDFLTSDEIMIMYNSWAQINNIMYKPTNNKLTKELKSMGILTEESAIKRVAGTVKRGYFGVKKLSADAY